MRKDALVAARKAVFSVNFMGAACAMHGDFERKLSKGGQPFKVDSDS